MQLMPATADVGRRGHAGHAGQHVATLASNVRAGVRLLAHYLARYRATGDLVLAAYYQGQKAVDRTASTA